MTCKPFLQKSLGLFLLLSIFFINLLTKCLDVALSFFVFFLVLYQFVLKMLFNLKNNEY
jgi:hypothetical protein